MIDFLQFIQPSIAAALPYRGSPRHTGIIPHDCAYDDDTLARCKEQLHLYMGAEQLRHCLREQAKKKQDTALETLYLWDSLYRMYAEQPHTQTLIGLDTDDPTHADALSLLIDLARSRQTDTLTPPLQLRTLLDTLYALLGGRARTLPDELDPTSRWTLCDPRTAAVLCACSEHPCTQLEIAGNPLRLLHFDTAPQMPTRNVGKDDRVCLIHGAYDTPTEVECAAAQTVFSELRTDKRVRRILPVAAGQLLMTALTQAPGLTLDLTPFADADGRVPYPCELVEQSRSGWLVILAPDALEKLQRACADGGLQLKPFAAVRTDHALDFSVLYGAQHVRLSYELAQQIRLSTAYRLIENRMDSAARTEPSPLPTPLLLHRPSGAAGGQLADARGCGSWFVRTMTLSMDDGFRGEAITEAIAALKHAAVQDGAPDTEQATLLCGFTVTPQLSRTVLWQHVLHLTHVLYTDNLRCLPIALQHEAQGDSLMTLTLLLHKPWGEPRAVAASAPIPSPSAPSTVIRDSVAPTQSRTLPLPAECSLIHKPMPQALIAYTADVGCANGLAARLCEEGADVRTLRIASQEQSCTVLADAILQADLVFLNGNAARWEQVLQHRRVRHALDDLVARDGLCLCQGEVLLALCRVGYAGERLRYCDAVAPLDACDQAFTLPLSYIRDRADSSATPLLRALPSLLPVLPDDIPVDDPVAEIFRAPGQDAASVLALTDSINGSPAVVRLLAKEGHLIVYADGFTSTQLREAIDYFR